MSERVYLETSIISYLAAHPSRDLVTAARQQLTHEWWARRRSAFEVCISELVVAEAAAGDPDAAARRAQLIRDLPSLSISEEAIALARNLVQSAGLPARAAVDALHISLAAFHGIDYLLTWNSTHIANAELRPKVERACRDNGYEPPVLCTPDELMGG
ncbi:MAG: type II toxin-antitoxin system VapC family toxin [Betaproteobacteria bacterium]|nr:type II toxin-antitoxin system VapC family toxin [Betaproteobacteria bacterium]MBI2292841.1 type II toxin-antitoxin system VapC family toxin [Betaproteobacteria bacterium]MBI3055010.1 type II toxin-antitoxin system VapC family toxin [Betaproteobacteria bacterium]